MSPNCQVRDQRAGIVREVLRSPGTPLAPVVRARMEARFGRDFGRVRLHIDDRAATSPGPWARGPRRPAQTSSDTNL